MPLPTTTPPIAPPPPAPPEPSHLHNTRFTSRQRLQVNCAVATADLPSLLPNLLLPLTPPASSFLDVVDGDNSAAHTTYEPPARQHDLNPTAWADATSLELEQLGHEWPTPPPHVPASLNLAVIGPSTGSTLEYPALLVRGPDTTAWEHATSLEIGRLTQGCLPHSTSGSETMTFIRHTDKPAHRVATYLRIVAELKPNKAEKRRVRFTVGGDKLHYSGNVSTPTADLTVVKCLLNSVVSTPNARFLTVDIKDFYLNTPMTQYEYMHIPVKYIPSDIFNQYNLAPLIHNDHVLVEIRKEMYGLQQAGILANDRLQAHLVKHGYTAAPNTPGLFTHTERPVTFSLVVDDFGIKYTSVADAQHLISTLQELYTISIDWTGSLYCGLSLLWDYVARTVDISTPGYVERALVKFLHVAPSRPDILRTPGFRHPTGPPYNTPRPTTHLLPSTPQLSDTSNMSSALSCTTLAPSTPPCSLRSGPSHQHKQNGTAATTIAITQLLNYCAAHPDAVLRFHASAMILHGHSDASYLSEKKARSRSGGIFFLSSPLADPLTAPTPDSAPPPLNGAVHVHSSIMSVVLSSATEAEFGALFYNGKEAAMLRTILHDMGHLQPATPIQTDNACAAGITNGTVKQQRSKAMDIRFYWIKDRVKQGQFLVHWRRGTDNLADYFTKHHSPAHHRAMRSRYLLDLHV